MALPARIKAVVHGLMAGSQTWSFGIWFSYDGSGPLFPADMNTFAQQVYSDFLAQVWNASTNPFNVANGADVSVTGVSTYYYPAGSSTAQAGGASTGAASAAQGVRKSPNQVAICASLLTSFVGASNRGRVYLPGTACTVGATNNFTLPAPANVASQMAAFLAAAQAHSVNSHVVIASVWSPKLQTLTPITAVRCDNVADTIRARRDKTPATVRAVSQLPVG